ncbi:hypothetical protein Bbelb_102230 [Branchiostoma belcheri]|nr:hypothetical protein Bbelb_102230 [Branchiostoma belcheri]
MTDRCDRMFRWSATVVWEGSMCDTNNRKPYRPVREKRRIREFVKGNAWGIPDVLFHVIGAICDAKDRRATAPPSQQTPAKPCPLFGREHRVRDTFSKSNVVNLRRLQTHRGTDKSEEILARERSTTTTPPASYTHRCEIRTEAIAGILDKHPLSGTRATSFPVDSPRPTSVFRALGLPYRKFARAY